ncbi:MAG: NADPH quinone reductase MdaB [Flavobacterium psychrophilum]|nr:MAG: NADPH quinone reductase MdaB [Flavobacterium psychrophilum]
MTKIFIINGGQSFGHSGGAFNTTIANQTLDFFTDNKNFEVKVTNVSDDYNPAEEVTKFVWADVIIYHTPIWWFQLPHNFKKYIDVVFTEGHASGIYNSDGRSSANPTINYGTGGTLHGRKYMLTTSWNAPREAFTLPGEFFKEHSVDEGVMFGFHRMNAFTGMQPLPSMHFHDIEKNADVPRDLKLYTEHLSNIFGVKSPDNNLTEKNTEIFQ